MPINAQPVEFSEETPVYTTVVRMGVREGTTTENSNRQDAQGTFVMIETRRSAGFEETYNYSMEEGQDSGYLWYAMVFFEPRPVDECLGTSVKPNKLSSNYSRVNVSYVTHRDYFHEVGQVGRKRDNSVIESGDSGVKIRLKKVTSTYVTSGPSGEEPRRYRHKDDLMKCFFEWELPDVLSIKDLLVCINKIRGLRDSTKTDGDEEFPTYCYTGESFWAKKIKRKDVFNCATFLPRLLKEFKVIDDDYDPTESYDSSWKFSTIIKAGVVGVGVE